MTCSWCDKNIQFFRALNGSRYCCDEHQSEEREHLKQLAIERLGIFVSQKHANEEAPDTLSTEPKPFEQGIPDTSFLLVRSLAHRKVLIG